MLSSRYGESRVSRPKSIILFERLFWISVLLGIVATLLAWGPVREQLSADPNIAALATPLLIIGIVINLGLSFLLWLLIARRGNNTARWVMAVLYFISAGLFLNTALSDMFVFGPSTVVNIISWVFAVASLLCLFRRDTVTWFASDAQPDVEPRT